MTDLPFPARPGSTPHKGLRVPLAGAAEVQGSFCAPTGRRGQFTGSYRLGSFVWQYGELAAVGVFTGSLTDADGQHIGTGSRRHTAATVLDFTPTGLRVQVGPLDVNLLGFLVTVEDFSLELPARSIGARGDLTPTDPGRQCLDGQARPRPLTDLMIRMMSAPLTTPPDPLTR